jgi:SAM-dependent methyltransferase
MLLMSAGGGRWSSLASGSARTVVDRMLRLSHRRAHRPADHQEPAIDLLDRIFARLYDRGLARTERAGLADQRRRLLEQAAGEVVEIGAGTGANLPYLGPAVDRLHLLEPTPAMTRRLHRRVATFTHAPVRVLHASAEALPFDDDTIDVAVVTLVLCTVEDLDGSIAEIRRVLHPDGRLLLIEHVAGHGRAAWTQALLERPWRFLARGCNLRRDTAGALRRGGFDLADVEPWQLPFGGPTAPAIVGAARPLPADR